MYPSKMFLRQTVSIREMMSLTSASNILLARPAHIETLRRMIISRLLDARFTEATMHVRLLDPQLFKFEMSELFPLRGNSVRVMSWLTEPEAHYFGIHDDVVIIRPDAPLAQENFLIVETPTYSRALVWWSNASRIAGRSERILGMLLTAPEDIRDGIININRLFHD